MKIYVLCQPLLVGKSVLLPTTFFLSTTRYYRQIFCQQNLIGKAKYDLWQNIWSAHGIKILSPKILIVVVHSPSFLFIWTGSWLSIRLTLSSWILSWPRTRSWRARFNRLGNLNRLNNQTRPLQTPICIKIDPVFSLNRLVHH